jgi:hypothetical protein
MGGEIYEARVSLSFYILFIALAKNQVWILLMSIKTGNYTFPAAGADESLIQSFREMISICFNAL